eukprot:11188464-Lingulodinium_polyedra.AAC.1
MLYNDAVKLTFRSRSASRTARSRTPCARQKIGARVECVIVRYASRCSCEASIRSHHSAAFLQTLHNGAPELMFCSRNGS